MAQRSLWRRFRRATRGPRNAVLAGAIWQSTRLLGRLPVPAALAVGRGLGAGAHALLGRPRRLAVAQLGTAFPDLGLEERRRIVRATFRHAGESFAELALWPKLRRDPDYVRVERLADLQAALAGGRGAIVVTGHTGNWELLAATIADHGLPISVVARRVNDARFDALVNRFRRRAGLEVLIRDDPQFLAGVRAALARNRVVAMLIDQDTRGAGVYVPFFGRLAHTPPGAALIALRNRVPLLTVFIERRREGGHVVRFAPVEVSARGRAEVTALTARLTAAIEAQIRRAPAEWVWWHERWRRRPEPPRARGAVLDKLRPAAS
jgi:Kdo2-lipid IVA lauroyltransferase/acyltransferase